MKTILVGVDGSAGARQALEWAAEQARTSDDEIVAVHVLTYSQEFFGDFPPSGMTTWRRDLQRAMERRWVQPARASGARVRCMLVEAASPADGLVETARRTNADLLVVGTQTHSGLRARWLAGMHEQLVHHATQPVVVVPHRAGDRTRAAAEAATASAAPA